ncbi:Putative cell wall binding repeat-containing protein, partial [Granulicatella balaenopterae]
GAYYLKDWGYMAHNEWIYDNHYQSWFFINEDGTYAQNQWVGDYYLKQWGYMAKNKWIYDKGHWYYLKDNGQMARNEVINSYKVDALGKWKK